MTRLKYGMKLAGEFFPNGTEIEVLSIDDPFVQRDFPGIGYNPKSNGIPVRFPGRKHVTIIHKGEVING